MRIQLVAAALAVSAGIAAPAAATPILNTESATASGTLGTTPFTDALVTVTLSADTDGVADFSPEFPGLLANPGAATLSIGGVGTFTFNSPNGYGAFYVPFAAAPAVVIAQFDNPEHDSFTHILGLLDPALGGYDLVSAFGPFTATGLGPPGSDEPFGTTGGLLFIGSGANIVTFTATSVPEPSTLTLLAVGALGLLTSARRRRHS